MVLKTFLGAVMMHAFIKSAAKIRAKLGTSEFFLTDATNANFLKALA